MRSSCFAPMVLALVGAAACLAPSEQTPATALGHSVVRPSFDINGDGRDDLLVMQKAAEAPRAELGSQSVLLSNGSTFTASCLGQADGSCGLDNEAYMSHAATQRLPGDYNGDGRSDVLVISGDPTFPRRALLLSSGSSFETACVGQTDGACGFDTEPFMQHPQTKLLPGDYNGDGRSDVLVISGDPTFPRRALLLSSGSSFETACVGQTDGACGFDTEPFMQHPQTKLLPGDYNGDGRSDVLVISGDPAFPRRVLLLSTGSSFATACVGQTDGACGFDTESFMQHPQTQLLPGDYNGDGRSDVLVISGDPAFLRRVLLLSTGSSFATACVGQTDGACGFDTESFMQHPQTQLLPGDYNGDGRSDVLVISGDPAFPRRALLLSTGSSFATACVGQTDGACGLPTEVALRFQHPLSVLHVGDYDGDGRTDLFTLLGNTNVRDPAVYRSLGDKFQLQCSRASGVACGIDDAQVANPYLVMVQGATASTRMHLVRASSFYGEVDITRGLQWTLDQGETELLFDGTAGTTYETGPLYLRSGNQLRWEANVALRAKHGGIGIYDSLLSILGQENVTLIGAAGAKLSMNKPEYVDGEWRHALRLMSARHVSISQLEVTGAGGDGMYLGDMRDEFGSAYAAAPNENIVINNVRLYDNARNGLSVISANQLLVTNSTFATSSALPGGAASGGPWAGIDLEPNQPHQLLQNITVKNCLIENNASLGFHVHLSRYDQDALPPLSIVFSDSRIIGSRKVPNSLMPTGPLNVADDDKHTLTGSIVFDNIVIDGDPKTELGIGTKAAAITTVNVRTATP